MNNFVQITTVIALVAGFAVVIWELQQGKNLAYAQILTDEITRFHDRSLALMGEDPREALAKASLAIEETETGYFGSSIRALLSKSE